VRPQPVGPPSSKVIRPINFIGGGLWDSSQIPFLIFTQRLILVSKIKVFGVV